MKLSPSELNEYEYLESKKNSQDTEVNGKRIRKLYLCGRSEAGKTTLIQALKGDSVIYDKTQYVNTWDIFIDTPGEYYESKQQKASIGLCCFSFESDLIGILVGADEPFGIIGYGLPTAVNRPLIGIITKVDSEKANVEMARLWLENAGITKIFEVDSLTGTGINELREYLLKPVDDKISMDEAILIQSRAESEWTL